jgi:site-specific DNA-methyltransferase (adenine-specific)
MTDNRLYLGDNLSVLRAHVDDESMDLVYLDPPFNSGQNYSVHFKEGGTRAFADAWVWNQEAEAAYDDVVGAGGQVSLVLQAFRTFLGASPMMAYLAMMAPRLGELQRVLKPTGSLYLHCDPSAGHYLKVLLDAVFGPQHFRNEIIWRRTGTHNDARRFASVHDCILYYGRSRTVTWNSQHLPHRERYVKSHYRPDANGRLYRLDNIIRSASLGPCPSLVYEYKGYTPPVWGWRVRREKLEAIDAAGRLTWSASGVPYLIRYLDEQKGAAMPSVWDDIPPVNSQAAERLGYATQKPEALLERILRASSNPGDTVLDPFCGSGSTVAVAQRLGRRWLGIDNARLAITLVRNRLRATFGEGIERSFRLMVEPPASLERAGPAKRDPVRARPRSRRKGPASSIG